MKRLVIILLVVIMLMGCSYIEKKKNYQPPLEIATEQSEYIMECVVNKDKEGLKSVFSKHTSETHNLDKEIDEFFEFIDGDIISYDEPEGHEGGYIIRDGEYREKELVGWTRNIKTHRGNTYYISHISFQINKSNEDRVGVNLITITDQTQKKDGEQRCIGDKE